MKSFNNWRKTLLALILFLSSYILPARPFFISFYNDTTINKGLPVIELKKNEIYKLKETYFSHAVGGEKIKERTNIWMSYNDTFLVINFECLDNPRVGQNYFSVDNSPIFLQEVMELFICNGSQALEDYLEIQINPNNAIYLAKINYRYKTDKAYRNIPIDTKTSGIEHQVKKDIEGQKRCGFLKLPLKMLEYPEKSSKNTFRLNIFRIISNMNHDNPQWMCTPENSTYACWNSTMEPVPQFHKPEAFGYLFFK